MCAASGSIWSHGSTAATAVIVNQFNDNLVMVF